MAPPNLDSTTTNEKSYTLENPHAHFAKEDEESNENDQLFDKTQSTKKDEDICSDDIDVVVPPDGGWGWVIVFASFMCNMIVDGIIFSFAMFLPGIAEEFGATKSQVTLVGSLMSGSYLMVGPFASAIANKFGFRFVAIIGALLGSSAFVVSYFATSVEFLWVSYGLLGGIGFGFIYVPSVITVGFYFEKWRALATGIGVCGSGIGTFIFAPLSESLIDLLGWRSALLVQALIVLTCVIFGSLFRPLKATKLKDLDEEEEEDENLKPKELIMDSSKLPTVTRLKMEEALKNMKNMDHQTSISKIFGAHNNSDHPRLSDVYHTVHAPSRTYTVHVPSRAYFKEKRLSVPFVLPSDKPKQPLTMTKANLIAKRAELLDEMNRPLYRDDIFFGQSLSRLPQYTSHGSIAYNLQVTRLPTKQDILEEKRHSIKLFPEAVKRALATMLDFSLLRSPSFIILALGGFFTMMGFYVPFMYLRDRAENVGDIPKQTAVLLLSSIGISNTMGRVLCGVLSSFPSVNGLFVTNVALTIGGLATILSGVSLSQEYQFFYTVVFGLSISCFASLRSIIVVDLLGLERLTNAFGLLLLFQGIAAMIGAPLAGAFMEATGSYDASFYLSGSMILISAIMCYPLNWINRWEVKRNEKLAMMENV